jgi:hypothetical protein
MTQPELHKYILDRFIADSHLAVHFDNESKSPSVDAYIVVFNVNRSAIDAIGGSKVVGIIAANIHYRHQMGSVWAIEQAERLRVTVDLNLLDILHPPETRTVIDEKNGWFTLPLIYDYEYESC